MKPYKSKLIAAFFVIFICSIANTMAIKVGTLRELPVGTIRYSVTEGNVTHFVEIEWGEDRENDTTKGPLMKSGKTGENATVTKLNQATLDKLFTEVAKLAAIHTVPRSTTSNRQNRDVFALYVGLTYDPLKLNFPKNEKILWNSAAICWARFADILKKDTSLTLAEAKQVDDKGAAVPKPGLASIADYTSMQLMVERVHRSKSDYGHITIDWKRLEDGKIEFRANYSPRVGDSISASPAAAQIRPIFDELQKLTHSFRQPAVSNSKNAASRSYDSINLTLMTNDQPGEFTLPYIETDSSQWAAANRLWTQLIKLFPEEKRAKIIQ